MTAPSAADLAAAIKDQSAILADWAEDEAGFPSVQIDDVRAELLAALDALLARCQELQAFKDEALQTDWITRAVKAEAERDEAIRDGANAVSRLVDRAEAAEARVAELEQALGRATKIAEHLFGMVDKATWRDQGAEWMGQYEGDYWAEQTWAEIKELAALQSGGSEGGTDG